MKYLSNFGKSKKQLEGFLEVFKNAIYNNAIDRFEYNGIYSISRKMQKINSEGRKIYDEFSSIQEDLFFAFFKPDPEFVEDSRLNDKSGFFNKQIMEQIMDMARYQELKIYTTLDEMNSSVSSIELSSKLMKMVKEKVEEFEEYKRQMQELMEQIQEYLDNHDPQSDEDLPQEIKDMIEQLAALGEMAEGALGLDLSDLAETMEAVTDMAAENDAIKRAWGLDQNDSFKKLPYKQKLSIFEKLKNSDRLNQISDMLGDFTVLLNTANADKIETQTKSSLNQIELSDNFKRAVPIELLKLADDDFDVLFFNDWANHALQTYKYDQELEHTKGPVVICIDESGSMMGYPEIWSKATALAVVHNAHLERRSVFVIHFANNYDGTKTKINVFPGKSDMDMNEVIDMAEHFYGGGTNFEQPLTRAMECIDTEEEFDSADILFITDGVCAVSNSFEAKFLAWKEARNVQLVSVVIGGRAENLERYSDAYYGIDQLTEGLHLKTMKQLKF